MIIFAAMWLFLAFLSAALLGFYDVFKKQSLKDNAVLPVLFLNTVFSSLVFLPFILVSYFAPEALQDTIFFVPDAAAFFLGTDFFTVKYIAENAGISTHMLCSKPCIGVSTLFTVPLVIGEPSGDVELKTSV